MHGVCGQEKQGPVWLPGACLGKLCVRHEAGSAVQMYPLSCLLLHLTLSRSSFALILLWLWQQMMSLLVLVCAVSKLCTPKVGTPTGKCAPLATKKMLYPDLKGHAAAWRSLKNTPSSPLPTSVLLWRGQVHLGAHQHFTCTRPRHSQTLPPSLCLSRVFPPSANMIRERWLGRPGAAGGAVPAEEPGSLVSLTYVFLAVRDHRKSGESLERKNGFINRRDFTKVKNHARSGL